MAYLNITEEIVAESRTNLFPRAFATLVQQNGYLVLTKNIAATGNEIVLSGLQSSLTTSYSLIQSSKAHELRTGAW